MTESQNLSLSELEKLYSRKQPVISQPDETYDSLKISKSELDKYSFTPIEDPRLENQSLLTDNYDQEDPAREAALETVSLFPKEGNKVVYRYDSPLTAKRKEIIMYKSLTFLNLVLLVAFLLLNIFQGVILESFQNPNSIWPNSYLKTLASLNEGVFWVGFLNVFVSGLGVLVEIFAIFALMQKPKGKLFRKKAIEIVRISFILFTLVISLGNIINVLKIFTSFSGKRLLYNLVKTALFISGFVLWRKIRALVKEEAKMLDEVVRDETGEPDQPMRASDEIYDLRENLEPEESIDD